MCFPSAERRGLEMRRINQDHINRMVLQKQHLLVDSQIDDVVQIIEDIGGLHAQVPKTPYLSLLARKYNFTKELLDEELYLKRNLGRIKCIRRTLYIFPRDMIGVAFAATKGMLEIPAKNYPKLLGITRPEYDEISHSIVGIIQGRGLTTKEIFIKDIPV